VRAADTAVTVFPVTVAGTPGTIVPYAVVRPYSKVTVDNEPFALTVPFRVAVVPVTAVAAVVTTAGGGPVVVKVISFPFDVPFELTPLIR
jgi:hypothetical protein